MRTLSRTAVILAVTGLAAVSFGQRIYSANSALPDQNITLLPWGSGTISESDDFAFEGTTSIRVSSRNFYQGGIIILGDPVDLSAATSVPSNLLHFAIQAPVGSVTFTSRGDTSGGTTGGTTGGPGGLGEGGSASGGQTSTTMDTTLSKVRVVITTTDGKKSEAYIDLSTAIPSTSGWKAAGIPLAAISGFDRTNKIIKSMAFSGDTIGSFYIGEIKVSSDETPLYVEANHFELNLALGDEVTFYAYGTGGATPLKYTWDFDASNDIDVDAEGAVIKRRFRTPGEYVITLTVHDKYGFKKPYSTTIKVTVNP